MAADRKIFDSSKNLRNPLLFGATIDFPFEQISQSALLVPQPVEKVFKPGDVEPDSFLGQEEPQGVGNRGRGDSLSEGKGEESEEKGGKSKGGGGLIPAPLVAASLTEEEEGLTPVPIGDLSETSLPSVCPNFISPLLNPPPTYRKPPPVGAKSGPVNPYRSGSFRPTTTVSHYPHHQFQPITAQVLPHISSAQTFPPVPSPLPPPVKSPSDLPTSYRSTDAFKTLPPPPPPSSAGPVLRQPSPLLSPLGSILNPNLPTDPPHSHPTLPASHVDQTEPHRPLPLLSPLTSTLVNPPPTNPPGAILDYSSLPPSAPGLPNSNPSLSLNEFSPSLSIGPASISHSAIPTVPGPLLESKPLLPPSADPPGNTNNIFSPASESSPSSDSLVPKTTPLGLSSGGIPQVPSLFQGIPPTDKPFPLTKSSFGLQSINDLTSPTALPPTSNSLPSIFSPLSLSSGVPLVTPCQSISPPVNPLLPPLSSFTPQPSTSAVEPPISGGQPTKASPIVSNNTSPISFSPHNHPPHPKPAPPPVSSLVTSPSSLPSSTTEGSSTLKTSLPHLFSGVENPSPIIGPNTTPFIQSSVPPSSSALLPSISPNSLPLQPSSPSKSFPPLSLVSQPPESQPTNPVNSFPGNPSVLRPIPTNATTTPPSLLSQGPISSTSEHIPTLFTPHQTPAPLAQPNFVPSAPPSIGINSQSLTSHGDNFIVNGSVSSQPQQAPPPPKGSGGNSYRLRDVKKVAYAAVPDLNIMTPPQLVRTSPPPQQKSSTPTTPLAPVFTPSVQGMIYRPVYHHWFYKKGNVWEPFSMADSLNLEQAFTSSDVTENSLVPTDGGRYDVCVVGRKRSTVYWEEEDGEVRRCSWFVRSPPNSRFVPYEENIATLLEEEYKAAIMCNEWNRRIELADGEVIILHGPTAIAHHQRSNSPDPWGNPPTVQYKQQVVKRGLDEFDIPEGEPSQVDHLLLVVHGIGKVCDLRFRSLVEVVDDFRGVSMGLISSHFKSSCELGLVGRVEILPVEWHRALHTEAIDNRLSDITLPSIPKAREFTNETLLDILFYTSPVFCERIVQAVGAELNRVYSLYLERNPGFKGGVSLGGHSLGSLILFDMLCHQRPPHKHLKQQIIPTDEDQVEDEMPEPGHLGCLNAKARLSRRMSYLTIGTAGTGQPYIMYPQLLFQPIAFFALGSPIGMFVTVRGIEALGEEFRFPTCPAFFNIFHPNDPVAYRIEPLISPEMAKHPAVLIPHHKGRKRMHLELKETMAHVTAALKQKIVDSVRNTWNTVFQLAAFQKPSQAIENEVDKVLEDELMSKDRVSSEGSMDVDCSMDREGEGLDVKVGKLNGGRRIDFVLQEAPLETFNQYISAVRSHVVYWESEDTMLMILKEMYECIGISADNQVPQPILPFDISSEDYADPGKAYAHYTESST